MRVADLVTDRTGEIVTKSDREIMEILESYDLTRCAHSAAQLDLERATGWRYAIVATNITRMRGIPGSHHPQWLDALHRSHATVEDRVRTNKAMGLRNLPSKAWTVNRGWVLAANLAADLDAWTRLLG